MISYGVSWFIQQLMLGTPVDIPAVDKLPMKLPDGSRICDSGLGQTQILISSNWGCANPRFPSLVVRVGEQWARAPSMPNQPKCEEAYITAAESSYCFQALLYAQEIQVISCASTKWGNLEFEQWYDRVARLIIEGSLVAPDYIEGSFWLSHMANSG
ncbi:hypothetical protein BGX38DRAFT_1146872 [Terfezia claveryi]|nr:hypothetical protein BGX38DRAFT_1146872 [Terfezia claveryi]